MQIQRSTFSTYGQVLADLIEGEEAEETDASVEFT